MPYTDQDAYKAVMAEIRRRIPERASPQSWLAAELGVSRQIIYRWEVDGFPEKHIDKIANLLGLSPAQIAPSTVAQYLPGSLFTEIADQAKDRKLTFMARFIAIVRAGISSSK